MLNGCFAKVSLSLLEMNRLPSVKVIITPHDTRLKCVGRLKIRELGDYHVAALLVMTGGFGSTSLGILRMRHAKNGCGSNYMSMAVCELAYFVCLANCWLAGIKRIDV